MTVFLRRLYWLRYALSLRGAQNKKCIITPFIQFRVEGKWPELVSSAWNSTSFFARGANYFYRQ